MTMAKPAMNEDVPPTKNKTMVIFHLAMWVFRWPIYKAIFFRVTQEMSHTCASRHQTWCTKMVCFGMVIPGLIGNPSNGHINPYGIGLMSLSCKLRNYMESMGVDEPQHTSKNWQKQLWMKMYLLFFAWWIFHLAILVFGGKHLFPDTESFYYVFPTFSWFCMGKNIGNCIMIYSCYGFFH